MKRMFTFLLALMLAPFALAADPNNPCGVPVPPATKYFYNDATASGPATSAGNTGKFFQCGFAPKGTGTLPNLRGNGSGAMVYWYCPLADGSWSPNWAVATWDKLKPSTIISDAFALSSSDAAFNALAAKNVNTPLTDDKLVPIWCPFQAEMIASTPQKTTSAYVVATNPASTGPGASRPAYPVGADGKRGTASTSRATVGADCSCDKLQILEGTSRYCSFTGSNTSTVALCMKKP